MLNIGAFFALLFVGAYRLPGGVAATMGAIGPLLVAGLSQLLLGQRMTLRTVLAALAGVAGVSLLVLRADARLDGLGVAAALGGTAVMALGVVLSKRWPSPAPPLVTTGWQLVAGGLFLLPIALVVEGPPPAAMTTGNLAGYAYLSLIGAALAYTLWFRGIAALSPTEVSFLGCSARWSPPPSAGSRSTSASPSPRASARPSSSARCSPPRPPISARHRPPRRHRKPSPEPISPGRARTESAQLP